MKDWQSKELKDKKRKAFRDTRISSDHNLLGEKEKEVKRDRDIALNWKVDSDGTYHVTPSSIKVPPMGFNVTQEHWDSIFCKSTDDPDKSQSNKAKDDA